MVNRKKFNNWGGKMHSLESFTTLDKFRVPILFMCMCVWERERVSRNEVVPPTLTPNAYFNLTAFNKGESKIMTIINYGVVFNYIYFIVRVMQFVINLLKLTTIAFSWTIVCLISFGILRAKNIFWIVKIYLTLIATTYLCKQRK